RAPAPPSRAARPAPAGAAPAASGDEGEVKPGARKDLWKCPHCGAGNKPDRQQCRVCGKSPDEPVVVPWHRRPLVLAGLALAVIALAVVAWLALRVDTGLRPARLEAVDASPRIGGRATQLVELPGDTRFEGERRYAVCGRVAAVGAGPAGTLLVALALGAAAQAERPAVEAVGGGFRVAGVVLACLPHEGFAPQPGQLLSVRGVSGVLVREGRVLSLPGDALPLAIEAFALSAP
ncbi:MAG: zinc ribbon domain-containing protein, partial [Planctomycetes bacterium]|nr:zinc ribbon domain-containing protein [Planctomycetota bacterium]